MQTLPRWYVQHHPDINPNKPDKFRRVCTVSSNYIGVALNDKLMSGPDLLQNIKRISFRFFEHKIAMTTDIEAIFLQVEIPQLIEKFLDFSGKKILTMQSNSTI